VSGSSYSTFYVSRSTNAQDPAATPTFVTQTVDMGGSIALYPDPNPGGLGSQPCVVADPTDGPNAGYVYMLGAVDPPGSDPMDVHFVRSTDGGVTWSSPLRINQDVGTDAWQWFATMSISPNGRLDVIWNDTRLIGYDWSELYYSFSTDGGLTWSPEEVLSYPWNSHVGWPQQQKIGDYYDMVSDLVGADLAWSATLNSEQDVFHMRIGDYDCNQNGVGDAIDISQGTSPDVNQNGIPDECEEATSVPDVVSSFRLLRNAPNPFRSTRIEFSLTEAVDQGSLRIFDVHGRLVRTLIDGSIPAGSRSVVWSGADDQGHQVAAGFYFYRLEAPGFSDARRMLLMK